MSVLHADHRHVRTLLAVAFFNVLHAGHRHARASLAVAFFSVLHAGHRHIRTLLAVDFFIGAARFSCWRRSAVDAFDNVDARCG